MLSASGQGDQKQQEVEDEGSAQPSLMLLPVLAILTLAVLNRDKLMPIGGHIAGVVRQIIASTPSAPAPAPAPLLLNDELMVEPVPKRKTKPRKA